MVEVVGDVLVRVAVQYYKDFRSAKLFSRERKIYFFLIISDL